MASAIISNLRASFDRAKQSGDLLFFPSTIENISDPSGVDFQIRICPALQHKPKLPTPHFDGQAEKGKADPFEPPYVLTLLVGELQSEDGDYIVLLNKYSVVEEHFLLVTKTHQSQSSPLYPSDLGQAYDLLSAARASGKTFLGFYNCGDLSGASQHHKHLQFIPIEAGGPPVEKLARSTKLETPDRPFTLSSLSYGNHVIRLPTTLSTLSAEEREQALADAFLSVLDLAIATIRHDPSYPAGPPSYNVLLTLEHIHLIPRRQENATLTRTNDPLSVNSMGFAGYMLVKSDLELEAVRSQGLSDILRSVALPSVDDLLVAGATNDGPDQLST